MFFSRDIASQFATLAPDNGGIEAGGWPEQPGVFVFLRKIVHFLALFAVFLATFARARDAGGLSSLRRLFDPTSHTLGY